MKKGIIILLIMFCSASARAQEARVYEMDLMSPEAFPVEFEGESEREKNIDLQAWLYSAQFNRLDMKDALENGINLKHKPEVEMTIRGRVKHRAGQALKNGRIVGYNFEDGKTNEAELDAEGRFILPVYDFNDGESFFLQAYDKKGKPDQYSYEIDCDTLPAMKNWLRDRNLFLNDTFSQLDLSVYGFDKENLLPGVVVKGKKKRDNYVPTNKFYSNRYIGNEDFAVRGISTFDQLIDALHPNVTRTENGIISSRGFSVLNNNPDLGSTNELQIIVDGISITYPEAKYMNLDEVASVEVMAPWQTLTLPGVVGATNGALVIKTKKSSKSEQPSQGLRYTPKGLANISLSTNLTH